MRHPLPIEHAGQPARRRLAAIGRTRATPEMVLLALTLATVLGVIAVWLTA